MSNTNNQLAEQGDQLLQARGIWAYCAALGVDENDKEGLHDELFAVVVPYLAICDYLATHWELSDEFYSFLDEQWGLIGQGVHALVTEIEEVGTPLGRLRGFLQIAIDMRGGSSLLAYERDDYYAHRVAIFSLCRALVEQQAELNITDQLARGLLQYDILVQATHELQSAHSDKETYVPNRFLLAAAEKGWQPTLLGYADYLGEIYDQLAPWGAVLQNTYGADFEDCYETINTTLEQLAEEPVNAEDVDLYQKICKK